MRLFGGSATLSRSARVRIAVVAQSTVATNDALVRAGASDVRTGALLTPAEALERLEPGDWRSAGSTCCRRWTASTRACGRSARSRRGESPCSTAHRRARGPRQAPHRAAPARARPPHPRTRLIAATPRCDLAPPVVVKPRFGSWGLGVERCDDANARRTSRGLPEEPWYRAHGALVQDLVPPFGFDLRIVVAADHAIGAISRVATPGEWRTNVALGAVRRRVPPSRGRRRGGDRSRAC